ncbi:MAG: hypothetical protein QOH13_2296 [Thermoleophilaceae bacterium]|nr:hypothetical protein [Thermoleophilaceae bacterium]
MGACAVGADADMTIAQLKRSTPVSAYGGRVVWSAFDFNAGRYRLMTNAGGVTMPVPVTPRSAPFDADVGPDSHGRPTVVYSRCRIEPRGPWRPEGLVWDAVSGCDLYRFDFANGRERRIAGASRSDTSEYLPSLWRGRLAFTRVDDRHRRSLRRLYVRSLADGREQLVPGGSPTGDPARNAGPAGLDLHGRRLAYVWAYTIAPMLENGPSTEVRVATAGGRSILISRRYNPDGIVSRVLSVPSLVDGSVFYALMTSGDSNGHRLHRSYLPGGRRFHGPRDGRIMVATASDATATYGVLRVFICREPSIVCTGHPLEEPTREGYELVRLDPVNFKPGFASGP